jgi:hypothetical protein
MTGIGGRIHRNAHYGYMRAGGDTQGADFCGAEAGAAAGEAD